MSLKSPQTNLSKKAVAGYQGFPFTSTSLCYLHVQRMSWGLLPPCPGGHLSLQLPASSLGSAESQQPVSEL